MKISDRERLNLLLSRSYQDPRNQNLYGTTLWGYAKKHGQMDRRMIDAAIRAERRARRRP